MKAIALVGLVGLTLPTASCTEGKASPQRPTPPLVYVTPVVERELPLYTESVATLDGYDNADIRARVRGFLKTQNYKDGAHVKAGELLFTIEPTEYATAVASARATLERAVVARDRNRIQADRDKGLLATGMISQQDMDNASASLADSEAQVQAARASLEAAALNLSYTQMHAPLDGVAGLAFVRIGNLVGQDAPTLLTTVSQVDPMRINFPIGELDYVRHPERFRRMEARTLVWARQQLAALDEGKTAEGNDPGVELLLADSSVFPHKGVIVAADRQIDPTTGTLRVQALVSNPDGLLRPGQYARARIRQSEAGHEELVVPQRALISVQGTFSVAVVGDDGKAHLRKVELGAATQGLQIVTGGVKAGERVVVEGVQKASDGVAVNAQPASAEQTGSQP